MIKFCFLVVYGAVIFNVVLVHSIVLAASDRSASTLLCVRNASASRGFGFAEKRWLGDLVNPERSSNPPYGISIMGESGPKARVSLERIFSGLDSESPAVREIEKGKKDNEFPARLLSRVGNSVVIVWDNGPSGAANWVWLAHIDRLRRLAVVTSVYTGLSYAGGELETMDCR